MVSAPAGDARGMITGSAKSVFGFRTSIRFARKAEAFNIEFCRSRSGTRSCRFMFGMARSECMFRGGPG